MITEGGGHGGYVREEGEQDDHGVVEGAVEGAMVILLLVMEGDLC